MPETKDGGFILDDTTRLTREQDANFERLVAEGKEAAANEYLDAIMASWELPEEERQEIPVPQ